jgi:Xaa-Pro dipeptidase
MISRIEKLADLKSGKTLDAILITSPVSVKYLSGYAYNFEIGPSPFQLIPAALVWFPPESATLVIADNEPVDPGDLDPGIMVIKYTSYSYKIPMDIAGNFNRKLLEAFGRGTKAKFRVGIESGTVPHMVVDSLAKQFPDIVFMDISADLARLRMIKDPDEILAIRASTSLCDIGQEAVIKYARSGMSELELFTRVRADMESTAGKRVPMMTDLVSGERTGEGGGNPSDRIMKPGDMILSDLTPCLNGYWGDTCNTVVVGKPTRKQLMHYKMVKETLDMAINAIKPGIKAKTIDQLMRKNLSSAGGYNHHSGHGVGIAYHEEPRIVPYNETILVPNMIIALEPGIYTNGYGIRFEHMVLVTPTGREVLSKFNHHFEQI